MPFRILSLCVFCEGSTVQGKISNGLGLYAFEFPLFSSTSRPLSFSDGQCTFDSKQFATNNSYIAHDFVTWHRRLGHPSLPIVKQILNKCNISCSFATYLTCDSCQCSKSHCLPFVPSNYVCSKPLEIIHSDLWGPAPIVSSSSFWYYETFIDEFTRYS